MKFCHERCQLYLKLDEDDRNTTYSKGLKRSHAAEVADKENIADEQERVDKGATEIRRPGLLGRLFIAEGVLEMAHFYGHIFLIHPTAKPAQRLLSVFQPSLRCKLYLTITHMFTC